MTFLMSFPKVFKRTMGLNDLEVSYNVLLGFRIIMVIDVLKWVSQCPISRQAFAMLTMFFKHNLSLIICLRCLYPILSGPGVDELLHLSIVLVNSFSEKGYHEEVVNASILIRMSLSMQQSWAILKDKCKAYQKSFISKHG